MNLQLSRTIELYERTVRMFIGTDVFCLLMAGGLAARAVELNGLGSFILKPIVRWPYFSTMGELVVLCFTLHQRIRSWEDAAEKGFEIPRASFEGAEIVGHGSTAKPFIDGRRLLGNAWRFRVSPLCLLGGAYGVVSMWLKLHFVVGLDREFWAVCGQPVELFAKWYLVMLILNLGVDVWEFKKK